MHSKGSLGQVSCSTINHWHPGGLGGSEDFRDVQISTADLGELAFSAC